jgi:hypothetical protein
MATTKKTAAKKTLKLDASKIKKLTPRADSAVVDCPDSCTAMPQTCTLITTSTMMC